MCMFPLDCKTFLVVRHFGSCYQLPSLKFLFYSADLKPLSPEISFQMFKRHGKMKTADSKSTFSKNHTILMKEILNNYRKKGTG